MRRLIDRYGVFLVVMKPKHITPISALRRPSGKKKEKVSGMIQVEVEVHDSSGSSSESQAFFFC